MLKSEKNILFLILLSISIVYFLSSCYINTSNDGSHYALVSAIVNKKTIIINDYISYTGMIDYAEKNGNYYSDRLPGNAFLMIPFFVFGNILNSLNLSFLSNHQPIQEVTVILLPNLCCVLALFFLFKIFLLFKISFKKSILFVLVFAFATLTWQESTHVFSHAPSMCLVLMAIYYLIKMPTIYCKEFYFFVFCLSYSVVVELQNLLLFIPSIIYLIGSKKLSLNIEIKTLKILGFSFLIFICVISILVIYNYIAFDEITLKSNKYNPVFPEESSFIASLSGNFWKGLDSLFTNISLPNYYYNYKLGIKNEIPGLFVTSPILLGSLLGFYFFIKKHPKEAMLFISIIIINVLIGAFHKTVLVRHIFTMTPFLFFPLVFLVEAIYNIKQLFIRYVLLSILFLLTCWSIFRVYYVTNTYWGRDIKDTFPFYKEMRIYFVYITFALLLYLIIKKAKPFFRPKLNGKNA